MTDAEIISKLLVAILPFAEYAGTMADHTAASTPITMGSPMARRQLTIGNVKLARDVRNEVLQALNARGAQAKPETSSPAVDTTTETAVRTVNVVSNTNLPDAPF